MRITLTVSDEMDSEIETFARRERIDKSEAMRRMLALIKIANREHEKGHSLGIIQVDGETQKVVASLEGV